jgi:L-iditol 2-dehydrogenase
MLANVLHAIGDLRLEEVERPKPKRDEVLLKVKACGICGSDIPRVFVKGTYHFPTIPGHEFAGEVVGLGEGVDPTWLGRGVAVFPLVPCRSCAACETGNYAQCANYNYLGSRCDGGFAEYVCAPVWNLLPLPDGLSYEEAAMVEPAAVAIHALRQAGIDIGDQVLIYGAGPIGLLLALWARAWGAGNVMLVDIDETKLEFAVGLGFDHVFNAATGDVKAWVVSMTGSGADIAVEGAGSAASFENCMHTTRSFGKVVLMGNPAGEMKLSQQGYWEILRKQLTVVGTWNSYYAGLPKNEWALALREMASSRLNVKPLISHRFGLDGVLPAMQSMRDRTHFSCKMMYVDEISHSNGEAKR